MQHICMSPPAARPLTPRPRGSAGRHSGRVTAIGRVVPSPPPSLRLRARRRGLSSRVGAGDGSGTTEPVPAAVPQSAGSAVGELPLPQVEVVAEVLESLEEAAIAGEDEGRRPTDYDRRAHIFEESSRVFRELKHRRDALEDGKAPETATR